MDAEDRGYSRRDREKEVEQQVNQKYPHMEYCGVLQKVQTIIKGG